MTHDELRRSLDEWGRDQVDVYFFLRYGSVPQIMGKVIGLGAQTVKVLTTNRSVSVERDGTTSTEINRARWVIPLDSLTSVMVAIEEEEDGEAGSEAQVIQPLSELDPDTVVIPDYVPDLHPST